jgi:GMP synthase-like glutamine amidotransferase
MFENALKIEGDEWVRSNVASGESLPEDITSFDGIIIPGSRFNCRDREQLPWFESVCDLIRAAAEIGSPKIYGGCFGCQIIAHALGGEVDYNPGRIFLLKAENIVLDKFAAHLLPVKDNNLLEEWTEKGLNLLVSHGDCVVSLPNSAQLIASSSSCKSEIYITGVKNNILACQSHPEFELKYAITDRIWKSVVETNGRLTEEQIQDAKTSFAQYNRGDAVNFLNMVNRFLRS